MKFKQWLAHHTDKDGFMLTNHKRYVIRTNARSTAREEAIAHDVLRQANPRENISGSYPWGPEEQLVLQQLWIHDILAPEWRDVPICGEHLYTTETTPTGQELPVPNAVKQPAAAPMDLQAKIREAIGESYQ